MADTDELQVSTLAAVELRAANGSNAAIAVMPPTPVNYGSRPTAAIAHRAPLQT
jgi:hypothetical protein